MRSPLSPLRSRFPASPRASTLPALGLGLVALLASVGVCAPGDGARASDGAGGGGPETGASPTYGDPFWDHWGDGLAEMTSYDLVTSRYGEDREGTAVAIVVTETFTEGERVKADRPTDDGYPVLKLNLVKDFPTGVYDYNLMTSAFIALEPVAGLPAGAPTKVSFSSQEWCGHGYHQALFGGDGVEEVSHSYFQGEADRAGRLPAEGALTEDALFLWARGFTVPAVSAGESVTLPVLRSLERARLAHVPVEWETAQLARGETTRSVTVPAGTFTVRDARVTLGSGDGQRTWTFWVEAEDPRRVIGWERRGGGASDTAGPVTERAELVAGDRLAYWRMNGGDGLAALERIGLEPRPPRTP